ncbi:hypothetical protein F5Y10DRAFT_289635 [Nemania abortiva]|nr:hypothetical protein F5Y10DRAFT_289635 [Nemania abortiva]
MPGHIPLQSYGNHIMVLSSCVFVIGVVVQNLAIVVGPGAILGGRCVTGVDASALSTIIPIYVAERAHTGACGLLIGMQQLAIEFGGRILFRIASTLLPFNGNHCLYLEQLLTDFFVALRDYGTHFIGGTGESQSGASRLIPLTLQLLPALMIYPPRRHDIYATQPSLACTP